MKRNLILLKEINNHRDGHHLNSKYWQDWKSKLPPLSNDLQEVLVGMILSDACMYKKSKHPLIKFEQGYLQKEFLYHLFSIFKTYCFMLEPGIRLTLNGHRKGLIKSYWFKTFSHSYFDPLFDLFYRDGKKRIADGLISNHLTGRGLAY